jgi:hypothetical protein
MLVPPATEQVAPTGNEPDPREAKGRLFRFLSRNALKSGSLCVRLAYLLPESGHSASGQFC